MSDAQQVEPRGKGTGKRLYKSGQSGNKLGRPVGAKSKITALFYDDLYAKWKKRGAKAIDRMIDERPGDFVRVVASLMPKELKITPAMNELSDEELHDLLAQLRRACARETQPTRASIDTGDKTPGEHQQIEGALSE